MASRGAGGPRPQTGRERARLTVLWAAGRALGRPTPQPALPAGARLLLVRPDHLGDLLFVTPALAWLRQALPQVHLTALVGPWGQAALRGNPHLDELLTLPFPGFTRQAKGSPLAPYRLLWRQAGALRRLAFDAAVILRFDHWWGAWLARLAGIPRVVGYDLPTTRPFLTQAVPYQPGRHEALQNLGLLQALLGRQAAELSPGAAPMEFAFPAAAAQAVAGRLGPAPYLCLHPGAGAAVKLWPADRWAQAADALSGEVGRVVLTGGPDELALAWQVAAHMRSEPLVLAGQTSLDELAAIFAQARLALGSDSGPLKLAQAVGAPTVQLYGPVDADAFGPWGDPAAWRVVRSPLPCVPCHRLDYAPDELPAHRCMEAIPVEAVVAAARELL